VILTSYFRTLVRLLTLLTLLTKPVIYSMYAITYIPLTISHGYRGNTIRFLILPTVLILNTISVQYNAISNVTDATCTVETMISLLLVL